MDEPSVQRFERGPRPPSTPSPRAPSEPGPVSWPSAPVVPLGLRSDAVHVWCAALDQPAWRVRGLVGILAPDERERAERFHFERLRRRFVVGRGVLRIILAGYLGMAPEAVRFAYRPRGKPHLADADDGALRFNVAHSGRLALYAVTRGRELGVDLEEVRPLEDAEPIAARYFSVGEAAALRALPPAERLAGFFRCWTRKEAYIKARGEGLAIPLHEFDVSVAPDEPARLLGSRWEPGDADRWTLVGLSPAPGYAGALAVEGRAWSLSCWQWTPQP